MEQLLNQLGARLAVEARVLLAANPTMRLAAVIVLANAATIPKVHDALEQVPGPTPDSGVRIGLVPRGSVEGLLSARFGYPDWQEQGWQRQWTLPVIVSAPDGLRFSFLPLAPAPGRGNER